MSHHNISEDMPGLATAHMSAKDLLSFVNDFPALLWRIEIAKSRIEFLNNNYIIANGLDGKLLMKNIQYQQKMIFSEDAYLVDAFMESVKNGRTAATVFRAKSQNNRTEWLKLTGATNSWDPRYYYGFLLNITDTVEVIKSIINKDINLQLLVDDTDNPALLLDFDTGRVLFCNSAACDLFEMSRENLVKMTLDDLYRESMKTAMEKILNQVLLTRKWSGKLDFYQSGKRKFFTSQTIVRHLMYSSKRLLRLTFLNPETRDEPHQQTALAPAQQARKKLAHGLQSVQTDISAVMRTAFHSFQTAQRLDAVIFSDVYIRSNRVFIYFAGSQPMTLEQGQKFPYRGTIAEDINRFQLTHITVDDTQESIKPIDWALFVPQGIRSYFAKPFFSRKTLRTVLILCSQKPHSFTGTTINDFDDLLEPLHQAIKAWRRSKRI